jgi:hypothetical protein
MQLCMLPQQDRRAVGSWQHLQRGPEANASLAAPIVRSPEPECSRVFGAANAGFPSLVRVAYSRSRAS